ncbi:Amino acid transporter [Maricaulis salignorans]|uniref:Amino acid transporter n=2 Tax=Maricaulis salignorans TaxID=144026 RepID=A0A1G9UBD3_9PROT|nr:Amino acid transporter [Maricaulis salignorans]
MQCYALGMTRLNRVIGLPGLCLYGIGVTLGAGIYALVGEIAGLAGLYAPWAFVLAGALAAFTGLSYAELGSRYPESAGEAAYLAHGFKRRWLTAAAGYGVALSGAISSAVVLHGFAGYLGALAPVPAWMAISGALAILVLIAIWGVRQSIMIAGIITLIEAGGLILIIAVATPGAITAPPPVDIGPVPWSGLFAASVMAFFAFIGFEDIANMAEEVKRPRRTLPLAILITLSVSSVIYLAVAWVAVRALPPDVLAGEGGPLAAVFEHATGLNGDGIAAIALLAMVNGALVQIVMVARVLYGLAQRGLAPSALGGVHPVRRTPVMATLIAAVAIAIFAMSGALGTLAIAASTVTLLVFSLVNAALLALRLRGEAGVTGSFSAPIWVPAVGLVASLGVAVGAMVSGL